MHTTLERLLVACAAVLGILVHAPSGSAQEPDEGPWLPPDPSAKERDWIRMNSGEWLNGEIMSMRDGDLKFDSEELDELGLDWNDVTELRSARVLTYRFDDIGIFAGTATMKDGVVAVRTVLGVVEQPRQKLIVILEGAPKEINYWSSKLSAGIVAREGNTNQYDYNAMVRVLREAARSITLFRYTGASGRVEGVETTNNQSLSFSFSALINAGFFFTPVSLDYMRDTFQNIDHRYVAGSAVGYYFRRSDNLDWFAVLGAAYVGTDYESVQAGGTGTKESASILVATDVSWDITSDIEFAFNYTGNVGVPDPKTSFHSTTATLSVDLFHDDISLDVTFNWERVEEPEPDEDGNVPERDDLRLSVGLGLEL